MLAFSFEGSQRTPHPKLVNLPHVRGGRWEILLTNRVCTDIWKAPMYMPKAVLQKDLPRKRLKHFLFSPTNDTNYGFRHQSFTGYDKRESNIQSSAVCVSRAGNDNIKVKINHSRQRTRTYNIAEVPLLHTPCCDASLKYFPFDTTRRVLSIRYHPEPLDPTEEHPELSARLRCVSTCEVAH